MVAVVAQRLALKCSVPFAEDADTLDDDQISSHSPETLACLAVWAQGQVLIAGQLLVACAVSMAQGLRKGMRKAQS